MLYKYDLVCQELAAYSEALAAKKQILVVTKVDLAVSTFSARVELTQKLLDAAKAQLKAADEMRACIAANDSSFVQVSVAADRYFAAAAKTGYTWSGWGLPIYYARAGNEEVTIELTVPKGAPGLVRVYVIDPDNFEGGRKQKVFIAGEDMGTLDKFQEGKWLEHGVSTGQTADGKVLVRAVNTREGSNAVISIIEWVEK